MKLAPMPWILCGDGLSSWPARFWVSSGLTAGSTATDSIALPLVFLMKRETPVISQTLAGEEVKPSPHKIQGIGAGFVPKNLDLSLVDRVERVTDDEAKAMALRLMREEGILCGISCGAAMAAAVRLAEHEPSLQGKTIVVILPDSGERYLSSMLFEGLFSEQELLQ